MRHAVIMAGGAGTRLWPLSRKKRPKQILRLFGGKSLLRQSFDRVVEIVPAAQINVVTNRAYLPIVAEELPEVPSENLIGEPEGRDTAAAVGLAAALLSRRDAEAVIGMFTADHIITPVDRFGRTVQQAYQIAEDNPKALVTMGIRPSRPDTSYGYVKRSAQLDAGVFEVEKFTEKPTYAKAVQYLAAGEYYWNSGMFTWRADTILAELKRQLPTTYDAVTAIAACADAESRDRKLAELYPKLMKISIDFAVMEHAVRVIVVEMDCHWVDVGSWPAMETVIEADADGNVNVCPQGLHLGSRANIVVSEVPHLIATIGVEDLVIVHSPDATLICKKRDAPSIRELLQNVRERFGDEYV
jgi:mannose-1-phosphate guanylyltransferase